MGIAGTQCDITKNKIVSIIAQLKMQA